MAVMFFTFIGLLLVITAMSVGVMMGRKPIAGSCGGISNMMGTSCPICGGDQSICDEQQEKNKEEEAGGKADYDLGYEAKTH